MRTTRGQDAERTAGATGDRRSPAKHAAVLDAATALFLDRGYARTSMNAIADAAGVSKQTLYAHFATKQRLFLAAVDRVRRTAGIDADALAGLVRDTGDPRRDLTAAALRLLRALVAPDHAALHRLTIAEATHHPELQRAWRDEAGTPDAQEAVAGYLRAGAARGLLAVPDPDLSARQFVMLLAAEAQVRSLRGLEPLTDAQLRAIADPTVDLLLRAHRPETR